MIARTGFNFMALLNCPVTGGQFWGNSVTKDKTGQTIRCCKCGQTGHSKVRA